MLVLVMTLTTLENRVDKLNKLALFNLNGRNSEHSIVNSGKLSVIVAIVFSVREALSHFEFPL